MLKCIVLFVNLIFIIPNIAGAAWLSSGGTDFSYRMAANVANPSYQENKQFMIKFPAFYLKEAGKIVQAAYEDVHITKADGTTKLPMSLDADKKVITVDYDDMPTGRTVLYIYYGHATVAAPTAAYAYPERGINIDDGMENGTDGSTLSETYWTNVASATLAYSNTSPKTGSTMSGKITGPASAYGGIQANMSLSVDLAEIRFWINPTATNKYIVVQSSGGATDQTFHAQFNADGKLYIYTSKAGVSNYTQNAYTELTTYATGWMQYKIVLNYTTQTYTLSRRAAYGDGWTALKAAASAHYNIPMRGSGTVSEMTTFDIQAYDGNIVYFDDIIYSKFPITNTAADIQVCDANAEKDGLLDTDSVYYAWGDAVDSTRIVDGAFTGTYFGAESAGSNVGYSTTPLKQRGLLKFFEGTFPKGTISSAKLHIYLVSIANIAAESTLKCHKFLNDGDAGTPRDYVRTGWSNQTTQSMPTWNNRFYDPITAANIAWQTAGAEHANEIDFTDVDAPSVVFATDESLGYKTWTLPTAWAHSWINTDEYSQGVMIKEADESGVSNKLPQLGLAAYAKTPVFEFTYSVLDEDQFTKRKVSTNTWSYATFPTQDNFLITPQADGFGVMLWMNPEMKLDFAYLAPDGTISLSQTNVFSGTIFKNSGSLWGIVYDSTNKRFYVSGNNSSSRIVLGYSTPYSPTGWTWATHASEGGNKASLAIINNVIYLIYCAATDYGDLELVTYTPSTDTWSATTVLVDATWDTAGHVEIDTGKGIASTDVMTGAGIIYGDGALTGYSAFGSIKINSEKFWYTGISGNNFTGVTREFNGTTAADHSAGVDILQNRGPMTYITIVDDPTRACFHITYCINDDNVAPPYAYLHAAYMRHYYADAIGVWKDVDDNAFTLPVKTGDYILTNAEYPAYGINAALMVENGNLVYSFIESITPDPISWGRQKIIMLPNGSSTFQDVPISFAYSEPGFIDMGSGTVFMSGLSGSTTNSALSKNSGIAFGTPRTISTYSFTAGSLWGSNSAPDNSLTGYGLAYAHHFGNHGAIYLDSFVVLGGAAIMMGF